MNVDNQFSGYRAAEVAANKARMEAARQEFDIEAHLRQLEEQEQRHSVGGMAEDDKSDSEAPSALDPAVSMFQLPPEFQTGRVVCDAITGPDAPLADLLNGPIGPLLTLALHCFVHACVVCFVLCLTRAMLGFVSCLSPFRRR